MEVRERVKNLLKELISIRSVSGEEREIQEFIENRLNRVGIKLKRQAVDKDRFNLVYLNDSPYVISCHVDTVPPIDMDGAFEPKETDGRIYGRGASDVKGALSALLTAVELFKEKNQEKELPVSLAFVVDEETNSAIGSQKVVDVLGKDRLCLVLEPTYGALCTAQNGAVEFSLRVEGESAHGAEFEKVENPIRVCMELIYTIENRLSKPVNVLMLHGGDGNYLVPKSCEALLEVKLWAGESWREVEERIREAIKEVRTTCRVHYTLEDAEDFLEFNYEGLLDKLSLAYERALNKKPELGTMPSWTDGANFHRAGYRCVVFGFGSLKDSHTARESIAIDELENMTLLFLELFEVLR
ncbi:acetylornithine deacetylase/succinyl-diaminopimelate desuccinylase [Hydrogenivirga caldilitoris]|uniref:Acetylornithine deacetylase/succinyl-diaminopimelate desuccinylase n=1 Tax=Hydrogenivirga caldilitoris TaxID=246264 RepID=A0A497XPU6_9AQUI|nr:M20/M25/M40 family metallo-hydrolase [Hydrogenivirga caldilitoris]RLJ70918.1 acetylornithine deacetylase/succinyl-diaminopimelate desuccinylase [Hydrogenivirga caldilitoris]